MGKLKLFSATSAYRSLTILHFRREKAPLQATTEVRNRRCLRLASLVRSARIDREQPRLKPPPRVPIGTFCDCNTVSPHSSDRPDVDRGAIDSATGSARRSRVSRGAAVVLLYSALTVCFTWPLATDLSTQVVAHFDPPFSAWRLARVVHNVTEGRPLFDGEIFWRARADAGVFGRDAGAGSPRLAASRHRAHAACGPQPAHHGWRRRVGDGRLRARPPNHRPHGRCARGRPGVRLCPLSARSPSAPRAAVGAVDAARVVGVAPGARQRPRARRTAVRGVRPASDAVVHLLRRVPRRRPGGDRPAHAGRGGVGGWDAGRSVVWPPAPVSSRSPPRPTTGPTRWPASRSASAISTKPPVTARTRRAISRRRPTIFSTERSRRRSATTRSDCFPGSHRSR